MAGIAVILYVLAAVVVVVVVWMTAGRREPLRVDTRALVALRVARRRSLVAISFTLVLLLSGVVASLAVPEWLGVGAAVAPAAAGVGGLLLYAATPPAQDRGEYTRQSASLDRRGPGTVAGRTSLASLVVMFVLTLALLIFTGLTSSTDDRGRARAITFATDLQSSTATPYPGWFYAVPLLIVTVLLAVAVWVALRQIASTASLPGEGLENLDRLWRARSAQVVVGLAQAAMCLQLGGVALFAGTTMNNAQFQPGVPIGWQILATCLTVLGIVFMAASIVSLTVATLRAFALPKALSRSDVYGTDVAGPPPGVRGRA